MQSPKSESLFHFTRSIELLKSVLENGFYPRFCLEDLSWLKLGDNQMAFPMVCFCDIPISRISEHTRFYGEYGIGLTKEWGLRNHLSPIAYTHSSGGISELLRYIIDADDEKLIPDENLREEIYALLYKQHSLMKPLSGRMTIDGGSVQKDFYQENEWRYIPEKRFTLIQEDFESKKDEMNSDMENEKLEFLPTDIRYIFVKSETDIPRIYDFIHSALSHFPHADIKSLITKIISLETISADL